MSNVIPFDPERAAAILERVLIQGDLSKLTHRERAEYYLRVCNSVGLNPLTQPFKYIKLEGGLKLYALKGCTDQLRKIHGVSVVGLSQSERHGVFTARAKVATPDGRTDEDIGSVGISGLSEAALANAMKKAVTQAKRRATLAICGLGLLDETEVEDIPGAEKVDPDLGLIQAAAKAALRPPAQTIDARYEKQIRAEQPRCVKPSPKRVWQNEQAAAPPRSRPTLAFSAPEPPPYDRIPEYADRGPHKRR